MTRAKAFKMPTWQQVRSHETLLLLTHLPTPVGNHPLTVTPIFLSPFQDAPNLITVCPIPTRDTMITFKSSPNDIVALPS